MSPIVMAVALAVAFGAFGVSAYRKWRLVRIGAPEDRFDRLGTRLGRMITVALFQQKMPKYKVMGPIHMLIFWGFLVLLVNTLILWGRGFDDGFDLWILDPHSWLGGAFHFHAISATAAIEDREHFETTRRAVIASRERLHHHTVVALCGGQKCLLNLLRRGEPDADGASLSAVTGLDHDRIASGIGGLQGLVHAQHQDLRSLGKCEVLLQLMGGCLVGREPHCEVAGGIKHGFKHAAPVPALTKLNEATRISQAIPWNIAPIGGARQRKSQLIQHQRVGQVEKSRIGTVAAPINSGAVRDSPGTA